MTRVCEHGAQTGGSRRALSAVDDCRLTLFCSPTDD